MSSIYVLVGSSSMWLIFLRMGFSSWLCHYIVCWNFLLSKNERINLHFRKNPPFFIPWHQKWRKGFLILLCLFIGLQKQIFGNQTENWETYRAGYSVNDQEKSKILFSTEQIKEMSKVRMLVSGARDIYFIWLSGYIISKKSIHFLNLWDFTSIKQTMTMASWL